MRNDLGAGIMPSATTGTAEQQEGRGLFHVRAFHNPADNGLEPARFQDPVVFLLLLPVRSAGISSQFPAAGFEVPTDSFSGKIERLHPPFRYLSLKRPGDDTHTTRFR